MLLDALESMGFRGVSYRLLYSYLSDRPQQVSIKGDLFNIYINDLYEIKTTGDVVSFADNTAILFEGRDWQGLKTQAEREMARFLHNFKSKLLTVNVGKTCFVPVTSQSTNLPTFESLNISDTCSCDTVSIQISMSFKYLGIIMDPHLRWNLHINSVTGKIRSLLHKFKYF